MPIKQASWKSLRQSRVHATRNKKRKEAVKAAVKSALGSITKKEDAAKEAVKKAIQVLDRSVKSGLVKKNTASRKKSRLMKRLNTLIKS